MAVYIYPAVFHPNDDGTFSIDYPDLPGCISEGKSLGNAMYMAQSALTQWLEYLTDKKMDIPPASSMQSIHVTGNEFVNFVRADIRNNRAIKRTVSVFQNGWTTWFLTQASAYQKCFRMLSGKNLMLPDNQFSFLQISTIVD